MPHLPPTGHHWLQQPLQQGSLHFLSGYMAIVLVVMVLTCLIFASQQINLPARVYWLLIPGQCVLALVTLVTSRRRTQVNAALFLALLLGSIALLAWYLHDAGGHTNPVISLLLVPLAMSAALLGWQATTFVALTVLAAYTLLTQYFIPLGEHHGHGEHFMQLHLAGMWLTFLLSVLLILGLVLPLALSSRSQQQLIARQQEKILQDEKLIAMATFATSAAHKLGTPLSTLAVLTDDLREELAGQPHLTQDLALMAGQIQICKTTLHDMMRKADNLRNHVHTPLPLAHLIDQLRQQFNLLHPQRSLRIDTDPLPDIHIDSDETLDLALLNLLDNAARESDDSPSLQVQQDGQLLYLRIHDSGPGVPDHIHHQLGKPFNSTRHDGLGLGLFLSHTTINRLGGTLRLQSVGNGTLTEVCLPITRSVPP